MRIFVDTGGWVAHFLPGDQHRQAWLAWLATEPDAELVTSDAVVIETLNLLKRKGVYRDHLSIAGTQLWQGELAVLEHASAADFADALTWFTRFDDQQDVSYTDALSYAMMRRLGLSEVVSFDAHFTLFPGITCLP